VKGLEWLGPVRNRLEKKHPVLSEGMNNRLKKRLYIVED